MAQPWKYLTGMVHTPPDSPLDDVLAKRQHDPENCPVENCDGAVDYLVKLRWAPSYRWRPDHGLPDLEPAVVHFEQGLLDKAAALQRLTQFLAGKAHDGIQMFETVHNCELFEACGRLGPLTCKELNDFTLQSGRDEIVFQSRDLRDLCLIPGMEAIYSRRIVLGSAAAKKARLLERGISIPPRGRLARPVIREWDGALCYFWVPFTNERVREERGDVVGPMAMPAVTATDNESSSEESSTDSDIGSGGKHATSASDTESAPSDDEEYETHPSYYTIS